MAIDAHVAYVELKEDGSGTLHLCVTLRAVLVELKRRAEGPRTDP